MDFSQMTVSDIVVAITSIGIISAFMFKVFSLFNQVRTSTEEIKKVNKRVDDIVSDSEIRKKELIDKVEETNKAVNLLCTALSALIDFEISEDGNKEELKEIKKQLDYKKEIV